MIIVKHLDNFLILNFLSFSYALYMLFNIYYNDSKIRGFRVLKKKRKDLKFMQDKYLPIGTVVLLKGGEKKVMITSYLIFPMGKETDKKMFDYGGCPFPEGIVDSTHTVVFNHGQIEKIIYLGLKDDEQQKFNELLIGTTDEIRKRFEEEIAKN